MTPFRSMRSLCFFAAILCLLSGCVVGPGIKVVPLWQSGLMGEKRYDCDGPFDPATGLDLPQKNAKNTKEQILPGRGALRVRREPLGRTGCSAFHPRGRQRGRTPWRLCVFAFNRPSLPRPSHFEIEFYSPSLGEPGQSVRFHNQLPDLSDPDRPLPVTYFV
jgi:hypothetical protein